MEGTFGFDLHRTGKSWGVRNVRLTYMEPHTKLEFDSAIGVTFNAKNPATDYKHGDDFIWDRAVGKKFANGLEVGVASYAHQQLTAEAAMQSGLWQRLLGQH